MPAHTTVAAPKVDELAQAFYPSSSGSKNLALTDFDHRLFSKAWLPIASLAFFSFGVVLKNG